MSTFEASEERRITEVAAAATEWIAQRSLEELVSESTLRSPHGTVVILECSDDYRSAMRETNNLSAALAPLRERATQREDLVVVRNLPMSGSREKATSVCLEGFGAVEARRVPPCNFDEDDEGFGNGAKYPGEPIDKVVVAVPRASAHKSTTISLIKMELFLLQLDSATADVLRQDLVCEVREDGRVESGPIVSHDPSTTLHYSKQLKENIEWAPDTTESVCKALDELHSVATATAGMRNVLHFALRNDDVFILDAKRWLFRMEFTENTSTHTKAGNDSRKPPDCDVRFTRGMWIPVAALSAPERNDPALPREPLILRALLRSARESERDARSPTYE